MALILSSNGGTELVSAGNYIDCKRGTFAINPFTKGTSFNISSEYITEAIINVKDCSTITATITAGTIAIVGVKNNNITTISSGGSVTDYDYVIVQGSSGTNHTVTVTVN